MKVRKLAIALALAGGMGSNLAYALGLGEAEIKSNLNEPLRAEISLISPGDLTRDEIIASLAPERDFRRVGIEPLFFLSEMQFDVVKNNRGELVLQVTTKRPVREPYLNFLVELAWPSGRLLREYALLIDPPVFRELEQQPALRPAAVSPAAAVPQAQPTRQPTRSAPAAQAASQPRTSPAAAPSASSTYTVTSADTLWRIAMTVRPNEALTPQQVMLALQDANPEAFVRNNINLVRNGSVLRIPDAAAITSRSRAEAVRQVTAQNRRFQQGSAEPEAVAIDATAERASQGASQAAAPPVGDELRLVAGDSRSASDGSSGGDLDGSGAGSADSRLAVSLEELDQSRRETEDLNSRVEDLESQLANMQRLIELKNDRLAALQAGAASAETDANAETDAGPDTLVAGDSRKAIAAAPAVAGETTAPAAQAEAMDFTPAAIIQQIKGNPLYQVGAGGIGIALLGLLWLLARRNARREEDFYARLQQEETAASDDLAPGAFAATLGGSRLAQSEADDDGRQGAPESSATAEAAGSDSEEDRIAEADVYIAYGRFDQAAQVLEGGISEEPNRSDLRLKLLEVYADSGNEEAFARQFSELEALDDEAALGQAEGLRTRLEAQSNEPSMDDLESQLRTGTAAAVTVAGADTGNRDDEDLDIEWRLDEAPDETPGNDRNGSGSLVEDFDFESELAALSNDGTADETAEDPEESFNFDDIELERENADKEAVDGLDFSLEDEELDDRFYAGDDDRGVELSDDELDALDLGDALDMDGNAATDDAATDDAVNRADAGRAESASPDASAEAAVTEDLLEDDLATVERAPVAADSPASFSDFDDSFLEELDAELEKVGEDESETFDALGVGGEDLDGLDDLELDVSDEDLALIEEVAGGDSDDDQDSREDDSVKSGQPTEQDEQAEQDVQEDAPATEIPKLDAQIDGADLEAGDDVDDSLLTESRLDMTDLSEDDLGDEDDFDFLDGTDETATKLDLARAYMEMGDAEGARDILGEVSLEGTGEQQKDAGELLKKLSSGSLSG